MKSDNDKIIFGIFVIRCCIKKGQILEVFIRNLLYLYDILKEELIDLLSTKMCVIIGGKG